MTTLSMTRALDKLQKAQEERGNRSSSASVSYFKPRTPQVLEAFSINFVRRQIIPRQIRLALIYGAAIYLVANIIFFFVLLESASSAKADGQRLQQKLQGELPSQEAIVALKQEVETMQQQATRDLAQLNLMITREKEKFPIGEKLAALAKTLPTRTWITDLSGDRNGRKLTIRASYLVNPEAPYELPMQRWMETLKADPTFGQNLKRLEVGESSQKRQGKVELCSFDLIAEWEQ